MKIWMKQILALAAPLLLTGCLWTPGKFTSELALQSGGKFVLDYKGEILLQAPEDKDKPAPWNDRMAVCYNDGRTETVPSSPVSSGEPSSPPEDARQCTPAEIKQLRTDYEKQAAERAEQNGKEAEQMAKLFGLPGADDESNRQFAAKLMKYQGWKAVTYRGKGIFDVDYHFEGRVDQDFAFPMIPDSDMVLPFITIRRRNDGSVQVTAPAFTGASGPFGARAMAMDIPKPSGQGPVSKAQGRFTVTVEGEILTNNSEDGPSAVANGRRVHWDVGPNSSKVPEMLVRLR